MKRRTARRASSIAFERSYKAALGEHVKTVSGSGAGIGIGRRAATLGVGTLGLARIHDRATAQLRLAAASDGRAALPTTRQESFFAQAVAPLEMAHCAALDGASGAAAECARLTGLLSRCTGDLAISRARLARETRRGTAGRAELADSERANCVLRNRSLLTEERMRRLSHQLLSAQEEERKQISRNLHDAIGQTLTGINVGLAALKIESSAGSRGIDEAISHTQQLVERSMKTVHQFAWELRPTLLDDLGLVPALRSYSRAFSARTGVRVRFASDAGLAQLSSDRTTALFRVAQGALENVERHARAAHVCVRLRSLPGAVRLEVKDNGRSFDVERMETSATNKHLGLVVMRERVEMVGGAFSIESSPGRGTTVRADIPLEAPAHD